MNMYIVIQYTNRPDSSAVTNDFCVRGTSTSYKKARELASKLAEQCISVSSADDKEEDIFACRFSTVCIETDEMYEKIKWYVRAADGNIISGKEKNGLGDTESTVHIQFIPAVVTLCRNSQAIHNLRYNAHRLYSGFHQNMRAIEHPDARGISLAYMLREVMMPEAHLYPKDMHAERTDAYKSMMAELESYGFNLNLLYMKPDDVKECIQKGTLPAKDMLADIGTVRRMLAYVWRHGGQSVQTYMEDKNLAEIS